MQVVFCADSSSKVEPQYTKNRRFTAGDRRAIRVSVYKSLNTGIIVRDLWHSPLTIPLFYIII